MERSSDPAIACATSACKCRLCGVKKDAVNQPLMPDNMGDKTKYAGTGHFDLGTEFRRSFVQHKKRIICHIRGLILSLFPSRLIKGQMIVATQWRSVLMTQRA